MLDDADKRANLNLTRLTQEELDEVLRKHLLYRTGRTGGQRAFLTFHDLSSLDMRKRDLSEVAQWGRLQWQ